MTAYNVTRSIPLSPEVAARKAARRKVIEKARKLERNSYLAMMRRKRRLQADGKIARIAARGHATR